MFKSLNRGLAAAVHMARPNQWRAMASMAKQKEDEMKNWTRDKVSSYAQSVISSEVFIHAFKAEELDGESLLDLPQNQTLMDALVSAGGKRAHVNKLAKSVRERVAPEPKTIFIALSETVGQGNSITIENQKMMDKLGERYRVGGFIDCSSDSDELVWQIEELKGGHTYRMAHDHSSRLTKMEGNIEVLEGTQKNTSKNLQADAHKSLQSLLEEEYGNNDVDEGVIVLDAKKVLIPKTPDGVFLVNTPEPTLWILEAKLHLTNKYDDAEEQLHEYKEAANVKFPSKSVVMVMAGHCCDATAAKAVTAGFKVLQQNGTQFTLRG